MRTVLGRDIRLFMENGVSALVEIGCGLDVRRAGEREMLETSDNTSGRFTKFIPGKINQRLLVSGYTGFSNGSQYDSSEAYDKLVSAETTPINFEYIVDNGTFTYTYSGKCLVKSFEESSPINGAAAYNLELQCVGEITKVVTGTYVPYYWVASDTVLTADEVVALIESGDPSVTSVSAPSYSTITINWLAPGGKYLYFAIPSSSPDRLSYYVSMGDQGRIGQPGDLFNYNTKAITIGGGGPINYKVYQSNVSKVNNSPMDLRTFYPTTGGIMGYGTTLYDKQPTVDGDTTVTFPLLIGVQLNKLVVVMNGNQVATMIKPSPAVPDGGEVSYDATTGTFTYPAGELVGGDVTAVWLT